MRYLGPVALAGLLSALLASGCQLPGREGPVSQSLATCRQLSQQGIAAMERGQTQQAEEMLAKAVHACPVDAEARRHYAEALWLRGTRQKAIAELQQATQLAGEDASLRVRLAEMYLADGRPEPARQAAEQAIDLNPKAATAWAIRGRVLCAGGRFGEALADYHRALGYAPNDRQVLLETAELYRRLNQPDRAATALQSLADTYSPGEEPQQVLHLLGTAYLALGRYDDATASLSAAAVRDGPSPEILYLLAEAELLAGRLDAATAAARQLLAMDPQHQAGRELLDRIELAGRPGSGPWR